MKTFENGQEVEVKGINGWVPKIYVGIFNDMHTVGAIGEEDGFICWSDEYIREKKEEQGYMDEVIVWEGGDARITNHDENYTISQFNVGECIGNGWVFSGYIIKSEGVADSYNCTPIGFSKDCKRVVEKATHARFVKVD